MESPPGSARSRSSQEAEIGHRVEDLWDVQEPVLTPSEKLNSCFESIPVSAFPAPPSSQVIEIPSDSSLARTVRILSRNKILSAPVCDVDAPEDASWIDRYIGIVEFSGIVVWLLHQSEVAALAGEGSNGASFEFSPATPNGPDNSPGCLSSPRHSLSPRQPLLRTNSIDTTTGEFFKHLTSSDLYKKVKVRDISGSFRWAPFLPVQSSDSFLTMLLLLSKYRMKSLPVVDLGEGRIENIITQSAVVHMLAECVGLDWFEKWGNKKLFELGLPSMTPDQLVKISEEEPVLRAFQLMRDKSVGGLPVVEEDGKKPVGNISIRDVQFLLTAPDLYKDYRTITAKDFLSTVRSYLEQKNESAAPLLRGVITCKRDDTVKDIIVQLDSNQIHRIYVVDDNGNAEGVITLRDIISKLVHEPRNYFGDFFDGVVPLPENSRV